jgi:hypothetical protein
MLHAVVPITHEEIHVTFSQEGMQRLKHGLSTSPRHCPRSPPSRPLKKQNRWALQGSRRTKWI